MLIRKSDSIRSSEITPKDFYLNRRTFLVRAGITAGILGGARIVQQLAKPPMRVSAGTRLQYVRSPLSTQGEKLTPYKDVTSYNNFYEFGTEKDDPARYSGTLKTSPWTVSIEGEVAKPRKYDVDSILRMHPSLEERVYRMRCVEGWAMVIPWSGIPLNSVLKQVQPTSKARYVAFQTLFDMSQMPGQRREVLQWPYVEGLRMDEAMHPLTILSVGLYGETLPNQDGAPIRLVVPWKYGFKSIKSIVKIDLVVEQPQSLWMKAAPNEYGFYSNVNPDVPHPRWSQATERRIGEGGRQKTLPFNGYAEQVASLYAGMDLRANY